MSHCLFGGGVVSASGDDFLASIRGASQTSLAIIKNNNLLPNGGFEDGNKGWSGRFEITAKEAFQGHNSCRLDTENGKSTNLSYPFVPLRPKTTYSYAMSVKREKGVGRVHVYCSYLGNSKKYLMSSKNWTAGKSVPVTIRKGEAIGKWQTFRGTFRCNRSDFGGIQLSVVAKGGADVVYIDQVQINELRLPEAPPWQLPRAVLIPGRPSKFKMAVENVIQADQVFEITTTGAVYRLDALSGTLACHQRGESTRLVSTFYFKNPLGKLAIKQKNADICVLQGESISVGFHGDSLILIATNEPLHFRVKSSIGAKHFRYTDQHLLAIDDIGGFCIMPYNRQKYYTTGSQLIKIPEGTEIEGWQAGFNIGARDMVGIAVFPPKKFEWKRSFDLRIVMTINLPSPDALRAYSEHATVLSLFTGIYNGNPEERYHAPYMVRNAEKLHQTIRQAHNLGMKVILYRHPMSYLWDGWDVDSAIADMKNFQAEFGFDGWYLDGLFFNRPWLDSWRFIRMLRNEVGDGVIYTHCTRNPPLQSIELYCPFIDAYSDFLLRGEGQDIFGPGDPYLRYVVGTYGISNSFATLKGDRMFSKSGRTPIKLNTKTIPVGTPQVLPLKEQLNAMLLLNGRCRWAYPAWPYNDSDIENYIDFYYERLGQQRNAWEKDRKALPILWPACNIQSTN